MFTLNLLSILAYSVYWFKGYVYGFSKYKVIYFANSNSCEFIFQIFITLMVEIVVVKSLSRVWLFATPWTAACQASLSFINSQSFLKLMSIESVMPSNHLILCHSLLLLPSIFPSIRVFSNESILPIRWPKYWSFSVSPSSEYSGLISLRIDWFDLFAVQRTRKSRFQLQARILEWVAFPFSRRSSQPRDRTQFSCIMGRFFTSWATGEALEDERKQQWFKGSRQLQEIGKSKKEKRQLFSLKLQKVQVWNPFLNLFFNHAK